jgi:hypothetical protein
MASKSRQAQGSANPATVRRRALKRRWRRAKKQNLTRGPYLKAEPRLPRWLKRQLGR